VAYYKTRKLRIEEEKDLPIGFPPTFPVLFFHPLKDATCLSSQVERMQHKWIPQVKIVPLDCGHWVMLEKTEEVTQTVTTWLSSIDLAPSNLNTAAKL